jgi:hypothetical protein
LEEAASALEKLIKLAIGAIGAIASFRGGTVYAIALPEIARNTTAILALTCMAIFLTYNKTYLLPDWV